MQCQLKELHDAVEGLSGIDRVKLWWLKRQHYITEPLRLGHKLAAKLETGRSRPSACLAVDTAKEDHTGQIPPLGLKAGERVRVKSLEKIQSTLDSHGKYEGMGYMDVEMNKHCGKVYAVQKPVSLFFDERRWRMLKLRDVVILEGVFCELPTTAAEDWAGCDRTCFLFWKEAWLERLNP